jgi:hypothetical protein
MSKRSVKSNGHYIYPKNFNHVFVPKSEFERCRSDVKNRYEDDKNMVGVNDHQMPDHPSTFMKMIKGRENVISAENDERRQVLNPFVILDGIIYRFTQVSSGYLFDTYFQAAYLKRSTDCYFE